ncbi:hypothetical protein [Lachnobacterium bovis]|uniref:Lipoprotein n=1 Tax=Lachnobacterium bovis TaxID=140626 RepID=A0A1H9S052_9FIRM|nr:hypothetical protein [Lachnobacterium bovis]SER78412.1 hypothetical protein SAMN02910429_01074 [Lachnobacterium bovis]
MKTWKLVSGILSIILFVIVAFQSCAAGIANSLGDGKDAGGGAGILVAVLMLAGGIVSIATRKSKGKGGNIALIIMFGMAALMAFGGATGMFKDLIVWGIWCFINALMAIVSLLKNKRQISDDLNMNVDLFDAKRNENYYKTIDQEVNHNDDNKF